MNVPTRIKGKENKQKEIDFEIKQSQQKNNTKTSSEKEEITKNVAYIENLKEPKKIGTELNAIYNKEEIAKDIAYIEALVEAEKNGTEFKGIYNKYALNKM